MRKEDSVLIVILNYKTFEMTIKLVEELSKLNYKNYRIMIVDNCSPNESAQVLENYAQNRDILFYGNKKNAGYAAGNNIGIRKAITEGYKYTWILNNDIIINDRDVLKKMVLVMEKAPTVGCVGPKIYDLEGNICLPYCDRPNLWSMTIGIVLEKYKRKLLKDEAQVVYRVHGCSMLLRNSVMEKIDCMDERTFLFGEEDILAERMRKVNSKTFYLPNAELIHMESATMKTEGKKAKQIKAERTAESLELYLRDYRGYNYVSREVCKKIRKMIIMLRG